MIQLTTKFIGFGLFLTSCMLLLNCADRRKEINPAIVQSILDDTSSFYFIDFKRFSRPQATMPIGIFDSGTGGLAVMEAILQYDAFQNQTWQIGSDGHPDFDREQFVFLADQANMPYGNYYTEGKLNLLVEHIIKDAQFLLSDRYYENQHAAKPTGRKLPAKVIVVACNTATVYGKSAIENLIAEGDANVKVIGVIDAGARGALSVIDKNENATVGILATVGTIASQGYATALKNLQQSLGYEGKLEIIGQGGFGLAEAIDGEPGFVKRGAEHSSADYKGPSFDHEFFPIDTALMDAYNFDRTGDALLCTETIGGGCTSLQLNAPVNYARYHLVSLLEQLRKHPEAPPLKAIILGCTHYPYLKEELAKILNELYHLQINGHYRYRNQMIENVVLIDPAVNVAQELAEHLKDEALFNRDGKGDCEFFISVPNFANPDVKVIDSTHFTHVYKYGRDAGSAQEFVKMVPFSAQNISDDMLTRFSQAIPSVYDRVLRHMKSDSAQAYKLSQLKIE